VHPNLGIRSPSPKSDGIAADGATRPGNMSAPISLQPSTRVPRAPELLHANEEEKKLYWDRSNYDSIQSQTKALQTSKTLYIGNLAFSTRSSHLHALFSMVGPISAVIMGLDRIQKTPCGFAFVEYVRRKDALVAISCLSGTKLDGRVIRVELDAGFKPGRQYGRGSSGGQVRN
jgi:nuclear cap-binding protein subunit 2